MVRSNRRDSEAKRRQEAKREQEFRRCESEGAELSRRLYELRETDPARRPEVILALFKEAQYQVRLVRQSIHDRTRYDFEVGTNLEEGDASTAVAEDIVGATRDNRCYPQTIWDALSAQLPDVEFTLDWYDASSMTSALLRETLLEGVIRGMKLAGATFPDDR